jgi:hypothetical protein
VLESDLGLNPAAWVPIVLLRELADDLSMVEIELIDEAETFRLRLGNVVVDQVPVDLSQLRHSADTNQDSKIDLSDLLRVIEIYTTRNGTTRTGRYRINTSSADGVYPDGAG